MINRQDVLKAVILMFDAGEDTGATNAVKLAPSTPVPLHHSSSASPRGTQSTQAPPGDASTLIGDGDQRHVWDGRQIPGEARRRSPEYCACGAYISTAQLVALYICVRGSEGSPAAFSRRRRARRPHSHLHASEAPWCCSRRRSVPHWCAQCHSPIANVAEWHHAAPHLHQEDGFSTPLDVLCVSLTCFSLACTLLAPSSVPLGKARTPSRLQSSRSTRSPSRTCIYRAL